MTGKTAWIQAYAVVRRDHIPGREFDPDSSCPPNIAGAEYEYTVKEVVLDVDEATREVERLKGLASSATRYFWQGTHLFPAGGSHGSAPADAE